MKKAFVILPIAAIAATTIGVFVTKKVKGESLFKEITSDKGDEHKNSDVYSIESEDTEIRVDDDKIEDEIPTI